MESKKRINRPRKIDKEYLVRCKNQMRNASSFSFNILPMNENHVFLGMPQQQKIYDIKEAKSKIEGFCAYQERTQKEVREKLIAWGILPSIADELIVELIQSNFINEERFAKAFAGGRFRIKKWGRKKIALELKYRGVSEYCIKKGLAEIEDEEYLKTLQGLLEKRTIVTRDKNEFTRKAKIVSYLIRKGFEPDLVWDELNQ